MTNYIKWIREITPLTLQPQCGLIAEYPEAYESRLGKKGRDNCQTDPGLSNYQRSDGISRLSKAVFLRQPITVQGWCFQRAT